MVLFSLQHLDDCHVLLWHLQPLCDVSPCELAWWTCWLQENYQYPILHKVRIFFLTLPFLFLRGLPSSTFFAVIQSLLFCCDICNPFNCQIMSTTPSFLFNVISEWCNYFFGTGKVVNGAIISLFNESRGDIIGGQVKQKNVCRYLDGQVNLCILLCWQIIKLTFWSQFWLTLSIVFSYNFDITTSVWFSYCWTYFLK